MMMRDNLKRAKVIGFRRIGTLDIIEFFYILYLWYSMFSVSLGIDYPYVGSIWMILLTIVCLLVFNWKGHQKFHVLLVTMIVASHILIQVFLYNVPFLNPYVVCYFWWPSLVVILTVLMRRRQFFTRLVLNMFIIAIIWSPFTIIQIESGVERVALEAGNTIDNSNSYASWLGFCALVLLLWSFQIISRSRKNIIRGAALGAVLLASRAISRGFVIVFIAGLIASFRKIKFGRTFFWVFGVGLVLLVLVTRIPYVQQLLESYTFRFAVSSSRMDVVPIAFKAIQSQPLTGYGILSMRQLLPITPHNELILLWFTSGIFPVVIYIGFVLVTFGLAFRYQRYTKFIDPLPILIYTIFEIPFTNLVLPNVWAVCATCYVFAIGEWIVQDNSRSHFLGLKGPLPSNPIRESRLPSG